MRAIRLNSMEDYILQNDTVTIDQLVEHFGLSINTIRRDLDELVKRGHVYKIYGGAKARSTSTLIPMPQRYQQNSEAKEYIAKLAAALVTDQSTVFLDSGSTTARVPTALQTQTGVSIITHSLSVMTEVVNYPSLNLIALGGIYSQPTNSFVGLSTLHTIGTLSIGLAFMAATGVSIDNGLSNNTYFEADIKRAIVENSKKVILLADHSKFDSDALLSFCPLERLDSIVTDQCPPKEYLDFCAAHHIRIIY